MSMLVLASEVKGRPFENMQSWARFKLFWNLDQALHKGSLCGIYREGDQSTGIYFPRGNKAF